MVRTIRSVHPHGDICRHGIFAHLKPTVFATAIVLLLLAGTARAWAALPPTFTVTVTTDTTSGTASNCNQTQGGATPNANCSLRDAIAAATAVGGTTTVNFDSALTSGGAVTIALSFTNGAIEITSAVNIAGPGATLLTVSDPDGGVFLVGNGHNAGPISISGLTFANTGYSVGPIGAIFINSSATVTVSNCTFSNNSTKSGGGGIANVGTLTVIDSTFSDNYGGQGGGGIHNSGTLTVSNSTFSGNSGTGGGINNSGTLTVSNSSFAGNSGSAIYNGSGTLTVSNSIFSSNSGGGMFNNGATASASYNVFYGNTVSGSEANCTDCTSNSNATDGDPKLAQLGNYGGTTQTMLPQPGSAAICAGSAALVPPGITTDQRGFPLNSSCVDAGAVQTNYLMVTTTADSDDGSCTGSTCSLRDAITQANSDTMEDIAFKSSVTGTITLLSTLYLMGQINLAGPGAGTLTLSGNNAGAIFVIGFIETTSGPFSISGLTLANGGSADTSSGGIFINGTLTVSDCTFSNNQAEGGGGAIQSFGTAMVSNSTFSGNSAIGSYGGAAGIYNLGALTVTNSTFYGNSAVMGVENYSTAPAAGGILNYGALTVNSSTFSGNSASGDSSNGVAAGIFNNGTLTVSDCTFSNNSASSGSGGIFSYSSYFTAATASYNVFFNNTASGSEADCTGCTSNTNAIDADPKLAPLGNYGGSTQTMLPLPGSAAICAGSTALVPPGLATDQRGFPRLNGTYTGTPCVDTGAVQTNYQSVQFTNASGGYSGLVNQVLNPAPIVSVTENGQNIGGVPVTLTFSGTGKATGLGPVMTAVGIGATFGSLSVDAAGRDMLAATLEITPSYALTTNPIAKLDITETKASQTINFTPPTSPVTYGVSPITLVATATSGLSVTFRVQSGPAKVSGNILTITGAGTIVIDANQAGNSNYAAATQVTQSITVDPQGTSSTLTSSATTIAAGQALTLTAKVAAASSGTPSGTVTFLDGATKLSTATLANGIASYSTATLAIGSHTLTAMYSGDSNYAASSSSASGDIVTVVTPDFTVTGTGAFMQTVNPGGVAHFSIVLAPANGVYPGVVTFAVTGLPTGATATFSPSTLAADAGTQTVALAVQTAEMSASNALRNDLQKGRGVAFGTAGVSLGMLLLPLALTKRLKRARRTLARCAIAFLFLLGGVAGMAGLSGCGGQSARTYTLVVTATSGSVKHSFDFILTVQ